MKTTPERAKGYSEIAGYLQSENPATSDAIRDRIASFESRLAFIAQLGRDCGYDVTRPEQLPGAMRRDIDELAAKEAP